MQRQRLTITLKNDVLRLVDKAVDGDKIRNRSHAIEYLLSKTLVPPKVKVLILAGGAGIHKAMIPISGKSSLQYTLEKLKSADLSDITISVGRLENKIRNFFGNGDKLGLNISYIEQSGKNGTAQPLKQAENDFRETFILIYGDVLTDINYSDLLEFHRSHHNRVATMALSSVEKVSMWGVAKLTGSKIAEFVEKPKKSRTKSHLVNAGIYVVEPSIFKYISKTTSRLEREVFPRLAEEGKLIGYPFEAQWLDISTIKL